jgi:flagellar hook-length control protein FliK
LPDAESRSSPSAPFAAAVKAISASLAKEAPSTSAEELDAPVLVTQRSVPGDAKRSGAEGLKAGNSPGLPANTADGDGKSGQVLPTIDAEMADNDPGAFQDQPDGMANPLVVATASSGTLASPEATLARPFDQVLRHMETRMNVSVEAHVKSPAFANELGEKVVWLAGRNGQIAELTLNPPQMGSVEIRLTVAGGEAGAQFFSANPAVREALETALPKLRELMAQAGINLGEANVRDQSFAQGKASARSEAGASPLFTGSEAANEGMSLGSMRSGGLGLVDLYA